ncbi:uncharacterized protein LOC131328667 [Rhododendron vialii]|uniref:uncharacterized protein LOC131328667 n=1 Tax=Rhododendron vialii TaxID=182163 RepID=UPI00265F2334|nr:uncharacterized protein LOC131328667 [Rhododendron vialii]
MTAAIRILAYGFSADHCDEYLKIGESTAIESLKHFCDAVIVLYEGQYLRSPNEHDIARLLHEGEERGFPRMLGTHRGHHNKPTLILEAVASKDLWIWHAFFGMAGSHNDVNVLEHSQIFDNFIHGRMPPVNYVVNEHQYTMGYYLADGIYPQWATLIQSIQHPTMVKERLFSQKQEAARKDVEQAFGVLQSRWGITQGPVRYWKKDDFCKIMKTCIILHNMIIEDEGGADIESWRPPPDEAISPTEYTRNPQVLAAHVFSRLRRIRNRETNAMLKVDLMEHLWNHFGDQAISNVTAFLYLPFKLKQNVLVIMQFKMLVHFNMFNQHFV